MATVAAPATVAFSFHDEPTVNSQGELAAANCGSLYSWHWHPTRAHGQDAHATVAVRTGEGHHEMVATVGDFLTVVSSNTCIPNSKRLILAASSRLCQEEPAVRKALTAATDYPAFRRVKAEAGMVATVSEFVTVASFHTCIPNSERLILAASSRLCREEPAVRKALTAATTYPAFRRVKAEPGGGKPSPYDGMPCGRMYVAMINRSCAAGG